MARLSASCPTLNEQAGDVEVIGGSLGSSPIRHLPARKGSGGYTRTPFATWYCFNFVSFARNSRLAVGPRDEPAPAKIVVGAGGLVGHEGEIENAPAKVSYNCAFGVWGRHTNSRRFALCRCERKEGSGEGVVVRPAHCMKSLANTAPTLCSAGERGLLFVAFR